MDQEQLSHQARTILESVTDAFFSVDRDWRFNYVNSQAERVLSRSPGDLLGKIIWDVYSGLHGSEFEPVYRNAMTQGVPGSVTSFYSDHNRWYEVHVYPAPNGISIYFRDVSEARRSEQERLRLSVEIERQARVFDTTLSTITDFAYILDRDARFLYVNRALLDLWGLKLDQALGKDFFDLKYPDELAAKLARQVRQVFETKKGLSDETPYTSLTGAGGCYEYIFSPVFAADGSVEVVVGSTRDVTERKRSEEQLRQVLAEREGLLASERAARSEAERTSRIKDEFLATLSHELRTPLMAILGWSQILADQSRRDVNLAEGLATIDRNARAQTQIIEDLLDMSRIISGKVRLDLQRVDLAAVLRAGVETLKPAADGKGVQLQAVLDPQAGPVNGDPNRLQQVFWNLLNNAVKFTPRGGRVQVRLERAESILEVTVTDTGEGIKPEFLPYVFDRFRQSDASTTRRHGGLGLGLAIVKQLVELHGGSVRASSSGVGSGATFIVSLPISAIPPEPEPAEGRQSSKASNAPISAGLSPDISGVRVLVLDDEPDVRALLKRLLEDCNAVVTVAASAQEALHLLQTQLPDVIISDIGMPGQDGYGFIRHVRACPPELGGLTPALALTAYARAEDRARAVMAGFQSHIAKPVEAVALIAMIAQLSGRTRQSQRQAAGEREG
ncbi:MAG: PAS domain-containing protein [Tepidisphaeraceae bacterium]